MISIKLWMRQQLPDQQHAVFDLALGQGAAPGQPYPGKSRQADQFGLDREIRPSHLSAISMEKKFSGDEKNIEINEENVKGYINRYLVSRSLKKGDLEKEKIIEPFIKIL
jgi:hypothetical protein